MTSRVLLILPLLLAGCSLVSTPTQQHPVCSWASTVPPHANRTCRVVFQTLAAMVSAEARDDTAALQRIATSDVVPGLISEGKQFRGQRAHGLHVVPSVTLETERSGAIGAGFYILGRGPKTLINMQETMQLRVDGKTARIIKARPGQPNDQQVE